MLLPLTAFDRGFESRGACRHVAEQTPSLSTPLASIRARTHQGTIVLREKLSRSRIVSRLANVPRCLIGIEAGMGTHYVARELIALGHDVRQVPPVYARPFRQTHKNDFRDAYAVRRHQHAAFR